MANSRGLEGVVRCWRRLAYVYRCGRRGVSTEWRLFVCFAIQV